MISHHRGKLNSFTARWLAEAVRLHQEEKGRDLTPWLAPATGQETADLPANAEGTERRILIRALEIGARDGSRDAIFNWQRQLGLSFALFAFLALAAGFVTALSVLGDSSRAVNVVWAITSLLGLHVLMLALWFSSLFLFRQSAGGTLGRLWLWASDRLAGEKARPVINSLLALSWKADLSRWYLSAATHILWFLLLTGAAAGLIFALSLRGYVFIWETTILPFETFVTLVETLGWLPGQLGFTVPNAEMVLQSGAGGGEPAGLAVSEDYRRAWSSWLLGCLLVYGILPRLIIAGLCLLKLRGRLGAVRLDLSSRPWAALAAQLSPSSSRVGVTDPTSADPPVSRFSADSEASGRPALLGLEMDPARASMPAAQVDSRVIAPVDNREQRHQAIHDLRVEPPQRLLIVCDAAVSPDRGNLAWMADVSALAGATGVWLSGNRGKSRRFNAWRESLLAMELPEPRLFEKQDEALRWLAGEQP